MSRNIFKYMTHAENVFSRKSVKLTKDEEEELWKLFFRRKDDIIWEAFTIYEFHDKEIKLDETFFLSESDIHSSIELSLTT